MIYPKQMIELVERGVAFEKLSVDTRGQCLEDPSSAIAIFEAGFFDEELLALKSNEQFEAIKNAKTYIQQRSIAQP